VLSKGRVVSANIQVRDVTHIREGERKVREALVEGQDAERKRISRELHDGLGQVFTAMKLSLQNMKGAEKHPCPDIMGQWLNELEGLVDRSIAEVKTISRNLSPDILTRFGLRAAIEDTVERVASTSKAGIDLQFVELKEKYDGHIESSVFRMFQELLTNALTHSHAQTINVQLIDHGDSLVLTVEDNGRGYDSATVVNGLGLPHVFSRAELLGGRVDVETRPGKGTLTTVEIPTV
jgi:signal transduction histidine kinase